MAALTESSYRQEVEWFRQDMTRGPATRGAKRTLYGRGTSWYGVRAEPGLKLYCEMANLYLKAFQNPSGAYRFHGAPNPQSLGTSMGGGPQIINATQLGFVDSYNSAGGKPGLGFTQGTEVTVTLADLNHALTMMVSGGFHTKALDQQRSAVARVVIGLIEAARFKDVEDQVVAGTPITDRNWPNHADAAAVMIEAPA